MHDDVDASRHPCWFMGVRLLVARTCLSDEPTPVATEPPTQPAERPLNAVDRPCQTTDRC